MRSNVVSAITSRMALLLGVTFLLGSAYFYQDPEWNGNSRLALTRAIVEQGRLQIDDFHDVPGWATGDKAFYAGHYYTDKAIGASILAVPVYCVLHNFSLALGSALSAELIKHVLTSFVMGVLFTVAGIAMFSIALGIAGDPWVAVLTTFAIGFGTMLWPYSAVFYGHVPAAGFLALSFALLFTAKRQAGQMRWQWFWIGISIAMAFISDFTSALVIPGLAAYGLHALRGRDIRAKWNTAWPTLPGVLIPLSILIAYNMAVYDRPLEFGYSHEVEQRFQEIMGLGVMGMRLPTLSAAFHISVDPKFGLLWLSPVLVLAPIGYWISLRRRSHLAEVAVSIYAIAAIFLMNAASYLWYGGSAFGPRLLISGLPFLIVPLAMVPNRGRWALIGLGLLSVANMLIPLVGEIQYARLEFRPDRGGFQINGMPFTGFSLLYDYGLPRLLALMKSGQSPWTLGSALGMPLPGSIMALLALLTGSLIWLKRLSDGRAWPRHRGGPWDSGELLSRRPASKDRRQ